MAMGASKLIGYDGYFATRLRELMKDKKVTQQELATSVGTTRQAISQYADGSVQPNIEKLYKIAEYFHISADYLLGMSDVATLNADTKAINKMLGLSEIAIESLKRDIELVRSCAEKGIIDVSDIDNTEVLLHEYAQHMRILNVSVINLLLEEPYRCDEEVLSLLGDVFTYEYDEEPDASFAISKVTTTEDENGDENVVAEVCDSAILKGPDLFAIRLLKLQQAVALYKKELDERKKIGDKQ